MLSMKVSPKHEWVLGWEVQLSIINYIILYDESKLLEIFFSQEHCYCYCYYLVNILYLFL